MGCSQSTDPATSEKDAADGAKQVLEGEWEEYELKKHRPECTGMFWRSDPTGKTKIMSNDHWPRDGAKLRGIVVEVDGEKWLLAKQVKQNRSETWHKAPYGAAMPFEHEDHYYLG
jgi:hypothetical protein